MEYNYFAITPLSLEKRDDNIDRIFYLEDKIKKLEKQWRTDRSGHKHLCKEGLEKIKNMRVKSHENEIKKLRSENKKIDLQILNKWRMKNGLLPKYRNLNGNLLNYKGI